MFFRWLNHQGVATESEYKMRKQEETIVQSNMLAEYIPMMCNDEATSEKVLSKVPCVQAKSLKEKVFQQLDEYEK